MTSEVKHLSSVEGSPRPAKRARLDDGASAPTAETEERMNASRAAEGMEGEDEYGEETATSTKGQVEPPKASDLYLDTVCMNLTMGSRRILSLSKPADQQSCFRLRLRKSVLCIPVEYQHIRVSRLWQVLPRSRSKFICVRPCHS